MFIFFYLKKKLQHNKIENIWVVWCMVHPYFYLIFIFGPEFTNRNHQLKIDLFDK